MVVDNLIEILEAQEVPVYKQGSMSADAEYPETFITFWNPDSPDHSHYDNEDYGTEWIFNVYVYSSDPEKTYTVLDNIRIALKQAGWICQGKGFDVSSDEETHSGRGLEAICMNFQQ